VRISEIREIRGVFALFFKKPCLPDSPGKKRHGFHGLHRLIPGARHASVFYPIHWAKSAALTSEFGMNQVLQYVPPLKQI